MARVDRTWEEGSRAHEGNVDEHVGHPLSVLKFRLLGYRTRGERERDACFIDTEVLDFWFQTRAIASCLKCINDVGCFRYNKLSPAHLNLRASLGPTGPILTRIYYCISPRLRISNHPSYLECREIISAANEVSILNRRLLPAVLL